jgi:hypothetical protein
MIGQNRKTRTFGRVGAVGLGAFFAANLLLALRPANDDGNPGDRMRNRHEALRSSEIRVMDIFGQNYGGADWSLVTSDLEAHPSDPANPAFMSVPLSLANVYLNRYEVGHDKADLERSVELLEWVAANRGIWGGREGTGSVVSYLDISVSRLRAECDIGGFEGRIDELWRAAMTVTAQEARPRKRRGHRERRSSRRRRASWPTIRRLPNGHRTPASSPCASRLPSARRRRRSWFFRRVPCRTTWPAATRRSSSMRILKVAGRDRLLSVARRSRRVTRRRELSLSLRRGTRWPRPSGTAGWSRSISRSSSSGTFLRARSASTMTTSTPSAIGGSDDLAATPGGGVGQGRG